MSESTCYAIHYDGDRFRVDIGALGLFTDRAVELGGRPIGVLKADAHGGLPEFPD